MPRKRQDAANRLHTVVDSYPTGASAARLHAHLDRNSVVHRINMADDTDLSARRRETFKCVYCDVQRRGVERAEALINKQSVDETLTTFETKWPVDPFTQSVNPPLPWINNTAGAGTIAGTAAIPETVRPLGISRSLSQGRSARRLVGSDL